jgi:PH (Pleckstrin Homology) domain-containing protein
MDKPPRDVINELGPGEEVQLFIKTKIYHPRINVNSVVITNERIILRQPNRLFWKRHSPAFLYTDLTPPTLDKGALRSTIRSQLKSTGKPFILDNLPNSDAEKAYGVIQSNILRYQTPFSTGPAMNAPYVPVPGSPMGAICRKCGHASRPGSMFCDSCGAKLK